MENDSMVCVIAREAIASYNEPLAKSDRELGTFWLKWRTGQYFKYSHGESLTLELSGGEAVRLERIVRPPMSHAVA